MIKNIMYFSLLFVIFSQVSAKNIKDSLFYKQNYLISKRDSLENEKISILKNIEKKIEIFTKKQTQVEEYKKEELVAGLLYKLAFFYEDIETKLWSKKSLHLDKLFAYYSDQDNFQSNQVLLEEYLDSIQVIAPELIDLYPLETLTGFNPANYYLGNYTKSIRYYTRIIEDYPETEVCASAYYNLAFILNELNRKDEAMAIFKKITELYTNSQIYLDANFMLGEYYFSPELNPHDDPIVEDKLVRKALSYYVVILDVPNNERYYYRTLYRLGFCHYRLYQYQDAIRYLTICIEELFNSYGKKEIINDMRPYSLEYLSYSFLNEIWGDKSDQDYDESQPIKKLKLYVDKRKEHNELALDAYKDNIFRYLSEGYIKTSDYIYAIESYDTLLSMDANLSFAPLIQDSIISMYNNNIRFDNLEDKQRTLYKERNELFERYNVSSEWSIVNSEIRDTMQVDSLLAKHLYENINFSIYKSDQTGNKKDYETVCTHLNQYLNLLPLDSNTNKLKWYRANISLSNLGDLKKAYDSYYDIASDSIVEIFYDPISKQNFTDSLAVLQAIQISQAMGLSKDTTINKNASQLEIKAYNKFIDLYPNTDQSREYIFNIALIYHDTKDYHSNEFHLRRIIDEYKGYDVAKKSYNMLYDEYMDSEQFSKAENITKEMGNDFQLDDNLKEELIDKRGKAVYSIAEKILKKAEKEQIAYSDSLGNINYNYANRDKMLNKAADEFMRTVRQTPSFAYALNSVWRASQNYAKAKNWDSVAVCYNYIIKEFPHKKNKDSLNLAVVSRIKLAELYADTLAIKYRKEYIGPLFISKRVNFVKAAEIYASVYKEYPDYVYKEINMSKKALNDAYYFYKQSQSWEEAINSLREYIDKYSVNESKEENIFRLTEMADLYIKIGREKEAFDIYEELGKKYPDIPLAVRGYYEKAHYYLRKGNIKQASLDFRKAYEISLSLSKRGLESGAVYASEALFWLTEQKRKEYEAVNMMDVTISSVENKKNILLGYLKELVANYNEVSDYSSKEYGISIIRRADILKIYADKLAIIPDFNFKDLTDKVAYSQSQYDEIVKAYETAVEGYVGSFDKLQEFKKIWQKQRNKRLSDIEKLVSKNPDSFQLNLEYQRLKNDTTVTTIDKLDKLSHVNVLEIYYKIGVETKKFVDQFVETDPLAFGYGDYAVEYFEEAINWIKSKENKIELINGSFLKTIEYARIYNMPDNIWAVKARMEAANSMDVFILAYLREAKRAIDYYRRYDALVQKLNKKDIKYDKEGLTIPVKTVINKQTYDNYVCHNNLSDLISIIRNLSIKALSFYNEKLKQAKISLNKKQFDILKENFLAQCYHFYQQIEELENYSKNRDSILNNNFKKNEVLSYMYFDLGLTQDQYLLNAQDLDVLKTDIIANQFPNIEKYDIDNPYSQKIFHILLRKRPLDYYSKFNFSLDTVVFVSDTSWKALPLYSKNVFISDVKMEAWPEAVLLTKSNIIGDSLLDNKSQFIWANQNIDVSNYSSDKSDGNINDSLNNDIKLNSFRKDFNLNKIPVYGEAYLAFDNNFILKCNQGTIFNMIIGDNKDQYPDESGWNKVRFYDFSQFLKEGKNFIGIVGLDTDNNNQGMIGQFLITTLDRVVKAEDNLRLDSWIKPATNYEDKKRRKLLRIFKKGLLY